MTASSLPPIRDAATVVLLRPIGTGLETLLLRRCRGTGFASDHWVFPGGSVDLVDRLEGENLEQDARRAARRETIEETGIVLDEGQLVHFAHWTTPPQAPKRYATWFFACAPQLAGGEVRVDGSEICEYRWIVPAQALEAFDQGSLKMLPPTYVSLWEMARHHQVHDLLEAWRRSPVAVYEPRLVATPDGHCTLYGGDAGYASGDLAARGPRHRFWMEGSGPWRYERRFAMEQGD